MHAWPWLWKIANADPSTAASTVGVAEHDVRALAAQLELHALQVARRRLHDLAAHVAVDPVNETLSMPGCSAMY